MLHVLRLVLQIFCPLIFVGCYIAWYETDCTTSTIALQSSSLMINCHSKHKNSFLECHKFLIWLWLSDKVDHFIKWVSLKPILLALLGFLLTKCDWALSCIKILFLKVLDFLKCSSIYALKKIIVCLNYFEFGIGPFYHL